MTVRFRGLKERFLCVYFSANHLLPEKGEQAMRKTLASLVLLGLLFVFLFLNPNWVVCQDLKLVETITIDSVADLKTDIKNIPKSFCVTEDEMFLIPDHTAGTIKILGRSGNSLVFIEEIGRNGFGKNRQKRFSRPMYCLYNQYEGKVGIIDYGEKGKSETKRIFVFERNGKVDLKLFKDFECKRLGDDIKLAGDGNQMVISGYLLNKENMPFDLYSINLRTGQTNYLLPSHKKYNLKTNDDYELEYDQRQTLPAIGIMAFIDIQGDDVFFVWEGAMRIIKLNLRSKEEKVFGFETPHYTKPNGLRLSKFYKKRELETMWKEELKTMSYIRNIFATSRHIFLVYETGRNKKSDYVSKYRLQTYTPDGDFVGDVEIPGNPIRQMWLDKESYELYAFSEESGKLSVLKYKININR